jgi:hypothetical protein
VTRKEPRMTEHTTGSTFGSTATDGSATDQVKDQVRDKAQLAQDKTRGALSQARGQLRDQVDQRSTQAGERVANTAADVRSIAEELRQQGKETPARMVDQAAGQAERFGDYLKGASGDRILRDVEGFARSKPWLVAAGGLALGFAASRVLKASSSNRYQSFHRLLRRSLRGAGDDRGGLHRRPDLHRIVIRGRAGRSGHDDQRAVRRHPRRRAGRRPPSPDPLT